MTKQFLKYFALFIFLSPAIFGKGISEENEYNIKNIPLRLLNDARAVVRKYDVKFIVEDNRNAVEIVKKAVTIFNKSEQQYGVLNLWYNKFHEINDLEGIIYDSEGEEVRDLESSDIKDYSDFESYSVYSDNRVKYIELYYNRFPYTIEYTYEIRYNGYLHWPSWYSRYSTDPVEETNFEVTIPSDYEFRYWCNDENIEPEFLTERNKNIYRWQKKNQLKLPDDVLDEDIEDFSVIIKIAPSEFEIDGYNGNMNTWNEFGKWYNLLSNERDKLPESATNEIDRIIKDETDKRKKVQKLYSFLQSKTRYVSVQLGIGGWQPYDAEYVYQNGYGDCKALSNFMVSILKHSGLEAYPVLIKNGYHRYPLINEFPSSQFNHVIVCVPLDGDTLWLECTSQTKPPGNIGWGNENREALMITPEGGFVVKTPISSSQKNIQLKKGEVKLSASGMAYAKTEIQWLGNQHDYVLPIADRSSSEEQEKWIKSLLDVPDIKLDAYKFRHGNTELSEVDLNFELSLKRYGSVSGSRIFFNPNLMERRKTVPKNVVERRSPVRLHYPYLDIDSIEYIIPEKYKVEAVPKEINLNSSFGEFICRTNDNGDGTVTYFRSLEIKDYTIPAENYSEYQQFFAEIVKADKQQVVLVKVE